MTRKPTLDGDGSSATTETTSQAATTSKGVGDSGYSTGCNSTERSGRSQSHSGSSRSSGYDYERHRSSNEFQHPPVSKTNKKKKKPVATASSSQIVLQENNEKSHVNVEKMDILVEESWNKSPEENDERSDGSDSRLQQTSTESCLIDTTTQVLDSGHDDDMSTLSPPPDNGFSDVDSLFVNPMKEGTFAAEVSMRDGIVLRQTESFAEVLGYPRNFWQGRQFIRMIRESDRVSFGKFVTSDRTQSLNASQNSAQKLSNSSVFCCLREYRGLAKTGFNIKDKETLFIPCQLTAHYLEDRGSIIIIGKTLKKAYKEPNEKFGIPHFYTTQSADCRLLDMDAQAVRFLGYLPHNILDQCVLNYYHPEDWESIMELYDSVTKRKDGKKVEQNCETPWSRPYRFRAQNGEWVILRTKFSMVFNIWTQQLHALIGKHRVIKGPSNPDVFAKPVVSEQNYPEEVLKDWKDVEDMIKVVMKRVYRSPSDRQQVSHKCKHLASFVKNFVDYVTKADSTKNDDDTMSARLSLKGSAELILGGISPHHAGCSKSSSETPPSYGQLNFRENIARFLLSGIDQAEPIPQFPECNSKDMGKHNVSDERSGVDSGSGSGGNCSGSGGGGGVSGKGDSGKGTGSGKGGGGGGGGVSGGSGSGGTSGDSSNNQTTETDNSDGYYSPFIQGLKPLTREILFRLFAPKYDRHCLRSSGRTGRPAELGFLLTKSLGLSEPKNDRLCIVSSGGIISVKVKERLDRETIRPFMGPIFVETVIKRHFIKEFFRHNEDMARNLILRHKERAKDNRVKRGTNETEELNHGVKRCGSDSWEADKVLKHVHMDPVVQNGQERRENPPASNRDPNVPGPSVGLWPPLGVPTMLPVLYYIPNESQNAPTQSKDLTEPSSNLSNSIKPVPLLNPFAMFTAPVYSPIQKPESPQPVNPRVPMNLENFRRPASQATSVKPEQGSTRGSGVGIAFKSVSLRYQPYSRNKMMSESSKNCPDQEDFSLTSPDEDKNDKDDMYMSTNTGTGDDSSFSLSSLHKTDDDGSWKAPSLPVKEDPPWLKAVNMTEELVYQYQEEPKHLENTLAADKASIEKWSQPNAVESQLEQLYVDLEKAGLSTRLKIDYENSSSGTSSGEENKNSVEVSRRRRKCRCDYTKLTMIHEEIILPPTSPMPTAAS